jgi:hypothetical protein
MSNNFTIQTALYRIVGAFACVQTNNLAMVVPSFLEKAGSLDGCLDGCLDRVAG